MREKGFTLVELLVSIGIISIIIAIGSFGYRDFARRQNVAATAKQVVGDLRLAQQYALSGHKPSGCTGTLERFEFTRVNNNSYSISVKCSTASAGVKSSNLPQDVTISSFSPTISNDTIGFLPVTGWTTLTPGGSDVLLTVGGTGTSFAQKIRIKPTGDISYEDP